ncbi:MAG: flagellar hook assembly protein FlgD [Deltaproteobacteria bacterium]|jgi:flagellar basal-body rod modification protein FlgD
MDALSGAIPSHLMADPSKDLPKSKNAMGKEDFMKLLMTQLQNQDPLKPMEHQEFAAQLAQFGSLEQLTNIQKGIEGLHSGIGEGSKLSALSLIGKKVQAAGNSLDLVEGQEIAMKYTSKEGVMPLRAAIYTEGGKLVREIDIARAEGTEVKWDGKDQEGKSLPSGKYTFRVQGVDKSGQAQELGTELSGRVTGVEMEGKNPILVVETTTGKTRLELGRVSQVSAEPEKSAEKSAKPGAAPASQTPPAVMKPQTVNPSASAVTNEGAEASSEENMPSVSQLDRGVWGGMPGVGGMEGMR